MRWLAISLSFLAAATSLAQELKYEGRVHFERTFLSGNREDWNRYGIGATMRGKDSFRLDLYSGERFDTWYRQGVVGWTGARQNGWTPDLELSFADDDLVVPNFGATFSLSKLVSEGLVLGGRFGYSRYADDRVLTYGLTSEYYQGANLYLFGLSVSDSDNAGAGVGANAGYRYYFTDHDYVGLGVSFGESRELASPGDIRKTPVFGGYIQGKKSFGGPWSAKLTLGYEDYRDLYDSRTLSLTVGREF